MEWSERFDGEHRPSDADIAAFIDSELWDGLNAFLRQRYQAQPKLTYSRCSMQRGWNIKYQKGGKSLCTLYPMPGHFIALVVIGEKQVPEAELLMPACCPYTRELYQNTQSSMGSRWLMMRITDAEVLADAEQLIQTRVKPNT